MKIDLSKHAKERAEERGTNKKEIDEVIKNGETSNATGNKLAKEKIFSYNEEWNGKIYPQKLVKVIYVILEPVIKVVTVIVRFGKWTNK